MANVPNRDSDRVLKSIGGGNRSVAGIDRLFGGRQKNDAVALASGRDDSVAKNPFNPADLGYRAKYADERVR